MPITSKELAELRTIVNQANEGLEDAITSQEKLKSIGVNMDLSKLSAEVARLNSEYDAMVAEYENEQKATQAPTMPRDAVAVANPSHSTLSIEERLTRLEMSLIALQQIVRGGGK